MAKKGSKGQKGKKDKGKKKKQSLIGSSLLRPQARPRSFPSPANP